MSAGANMESREEIVAALRKPGTSGWNGAFVAARTSEGISVGVFENNRDYVGTVTESELREMVDGFEREGWVPMEREDVRVTAGI
jgi:hypothetical protein